jgi:hypothetical protein
MVPFPEPLWGELQPWRGVQGARRAGVGPQKTASEPRLDKGYIRRSSGLAGAKASRPRAVPAATRPPVGLPTAAPPDREGRHRRPPLRAGRLCGSANSAGGASSGRYSGTAGVAGSAGSPNTFQFSADSRTCSIRTPKIIDATQYDQSCQSDTDCVVIFTGGCAPRASVTHCVFPPDGPGICASGWRLEFVNVWRIGDAALHRQSTATKCRLRS